jgi:hypothetical protein
MMELLYIILATLVVVGVAAFSYFIAGAFICLTADVIIFFTKEKREEDKK